MWEALELRLPTTIVVQHKITIPTTIISWQLQLVSDRRPAGRQAGRHDWQQYQSAPLVAVFNEMVVDDWRRQELGINNSGIDLGVPEYPGFNLKWLRIMTGTTWTNHS